VQKDGDAPNKKIHHRNSGEGNKRGGYQGHKDVDRTHSPDDDFKRKNKKGKMQFTDSNPFSILKSDK
jgi:hypothetical protein